MQYIAKAVQYYKDINPATLSGAIDVIVVERKDETGTTLAASPFHVRFGKLSVLRPIDKKVRITVNDEPIPFFMKVGETGEAFFVFETDVELPEDMQTSPLTGPLSDEEIEAPGEPEFLDLGASQTGSTLLNSELMERDVLVRSESTSSLDSTASHSRYASMDQSRLTSPTATFHPLPPLSNSFDTESILPISFNPVSLVPAAASVVIGAASNLGRAAITGLSGNRKLSDLTEIRTSSLETFDENGVVNGSSEQELGELEKKMREDLGGLTLSDESTSNILNRTGEDVRIAAREKDEDLRNILSKSDDQIDTETDLILSKATGLHHERNESGNRPEMAGDLMLDMAGYKIEDDLPLTNDSSAHTPLNEDILNPELDSALDNRAEKELIAFTQGLLQSADPKTLSGFFGPVEPSDLSGEAQSVPPPLIGDLDIDTLRSHSSTSLPSLGRIDSQEEFIENDKEKGAGIFQASPKEFSLKIGGKLHIFELSLGGGGKFGQDPIYDGDAFLAQQVTSSQFMNEDTITGHANLVVKYAGRYLTWENASPVLASLAVYRKSLVDHPEYHTVSRLDNDIDLTGVEIDNKRSSRGWGLWWSKKSTVEPILPISGIDSSQPTSPAISEPNSPRNYPLPTSPELEVPLDSVQIDLRKHYAKTLRLTSDQLKQLGLKKGVNTISFSVRSSYSGYATCTSRIFLWESDFQVVISDIDGTITKSDALGHVFTMIGRDWTHLGVAKLYTDIARNGYKMMYLTSRAIGQADITREYLKGIKQNGYVLPDGPVIMSPDRLMTSLHREVVLRKPEVFKMACLRDIQRLFSERGTPFYSGFGNRITDALSYRSVDIPSSKIFTIDTNGEVKMELLELAGYKSSYIHMTDLVDQMFPPINRKTTPDYTDFNFWRQPVAQFDLPDFPPPSPALSARSDTSSRLGLKRLGSLATSLSRRSSRATLVEGSGGIIRKNGIPTSPLLQATLMEESNGISDEDYDDRSESSSMPGSLPNEENFEQRYRNAKNQENNQGEDSESEEEEEELEGEMDEFGEELDFSSVPY